VKPGGKKFDISSFAFGGGAKSGTSRIAAMPLPKRKYLGAATDDEVDARLRKG
jgi:hypothetical protein